MEGELYQGGQDEDLLHLSRGTGAPWPPLWSPKGSKAQKRKFTAWRLDKTLFFLICLLQRFTWENENSSSTVQTPLVPNLCQGWGIFDRWHEGPVFKRLPLGTELAVVVCHSSGENPAMSAIWEKKKVLRESKALKKKKFLLFASVDWEPAGTCVDNPASCRSSCVSC